MIRMHLAFVFTAIVAVSGFAPATNTVKFRSSNACERVNCALKMGNKVAIPNPFKALPWNVKKEMEREAKRYKMENAKLHRELGISEDATFEEITEVTEKLIRAANKEGDVKKKIKAEIAKDRIMQIRLNERLAGLSKVTDDAKAQSRREEEDEDDLEEEEKPKEWGAPKWIEGIIKKPEPKWRNKIIQVFGGMSFIGLVFPPLANTFMMLNGYFTAGMMSRRGMPETGGAGGGMFQSRKNSSHQRKAILIAFGMWTFLRVFVLNLGNIKNILGGRYVPVVELAVMNIGLGLLVAYIQTYKGA